MVMYSGSSPGAKPPRGSVFHRRYVPSRNRGPSARPPSPKNRASAATSDRCCQRAGPPPTGSHQRGGSSRRSTIPPGVHTSTAPCREMTTVSRSETTRQPPSLSGSSDALGSGSGALPFRAYDGSGPAPSQPQNTAPPAATRTSSSERANRTTPPPGRGSASVTAPGTRARSGPRADSSRASARRRRSAERIARRPCTVPTAFTERTRSSPFMQLTLPPGRPCVRFVQLPFIRGGTTWPGIRLWVAHPGAEDDHMASSLSAASRAHP